MGVSASACRLVWSVPAAVAVMAVGALGPAMAASKVGVAEEIRNSVKAKARKKERALEKESPVYRKETVSAAQDSSGRFRFNDDTRLTLGPGASVTLNDIVIGEESKSAKKFASTEVNPDSPQSIEFLKLMQERAKRTEVKSQYL